MKTIDERLTEGRQYRDIDLGSFEHRIAEDGKMVVRGYATTFNQPYELWHEDGYTVMEQVDARAFEGADMADIIMQYNHEGRVFARVSNNTLRVATDERGLPIEADLSGTTLGRQLYEEIDGGYTTKMSFGFTVAEDKRDVTEDHDTGNVTILRTITRIRKVFDVSAVALPANNLTSLQSARAYCEGAIAEAKEEIRARKEREEQKNRILEAINGI